MVKLENFSLQYNHDKIIFQDVNLHISPNKITLLTGANGSGKTSLLRVLSGLHKKYSGKIILDNQDLSAYSVESLAEKIIYLKQEPYANLVATTPIEDLGIRLHKYSKTKIDETAIISALEAFKMEDFIHKPIWKLSGGQAKRIGLAALKLSDNKFWLLDEPTSGLDTKLQNILLEIIYNHKAHGALIISHRLELFSQIADTIYIISDKKIKKISGK
jgi:energy-coupling factor transporter ATP-binding protein EcfA2